MADTRLKSFIDRVLRLKEEQDALSADIREIYAEAKGDGFDKTAMGEVVSYLRKVEKKGKDAVAEHGAMFDLYLDAYERPSHVHAREGHPSDRGGSNPDLNPSAAHGAGASAAPYPHSQAAPPPADKADAAHSSLAASATPADESYVPAFLRRQEA